jgi:ubiquinol-cytochrome c reductase cytochrome c subunit
MVSAQTPDAASAVRGQQLYQKNMCVTCHGTVGNGGERTSGPRIAPNVWPLDAMKTQLRSPRQDMPRYGEKFVSDADLADIHAYLSTIKGGPKAKDIPLLSAL